MEDKIIAILEKYQNWGFESNTMSVCPGKYELVAKEIAALSNKRYSKGFKAGQSSIQRRNASGCCCTFSDDDTKIIKLCGAHEDYYMEEKWIKRR